MQRFLAQPDDTERLGGELFAALPKQALVFLHGDLGAGKTTLVRGFLRAAGYQGAVKSPTYNLVEAYQLPELTVYHFDLYRLNDPEELALIGIRDYLQEQAICFVEWPEQGKNQLPKPDLTISLSVQQTGRLAEIQDSNLALP